jgi:hypothetical protein
MAARTRLGTSGHGQRRYLLGFSGKTPDLGIVNDAYLSALAVASYGIKKAGIPSNTLPWLKTNMEIMLGRRNNAIPVPIKRTLTFSATPTKAECEALYDYANSLQDALSRFITRFDS